jgi:hypothetical protein
MADEMPDDEEMPPQQGESLGGMMPKPDGNGGAAPDAEPDSGDTQEQDEGEGEEGGQGQGNGRKASPEQQQQYDAFVGQCYHVIYAKGQVNPAIANLLKVGDPISAVAHATVNVVLRVMTSAKQNNIQFDPGVLLKGGQEVYQDLCDLSGKLGIHKFTEGEVDAGWVQTMHLAQQQMQQAGLIDPKAFVRDQQELNQAAENGNIDDYLPGVGGLVKDVQAAQQQKGDQQQQPPEGDGEDQPSGKFSGFGKGA